MWGGWRLEAERFSSATLRASNLFQWLLSKMVNFFRGQSIFLKLFRGFNVTLYQADRRSRERIDLVKCDHGQLGD